MKLGKGAALFVIVAAAAGCASRPPAPVVERAPGAQAPAAPIARPPAVKTYTVKRGETLFGIARTVYGDAGRWREIASLNALSYPHDLRRGLRLRLP